MTHSDYNAFLNEIETTQMSPIRGGHGCRKIYKMVLLLAMLEIDGRNKGNWWTAITPAQAAPFFHHILTHYDTIRDVQFSDQDKKDYRFSFTDKARKFTENLIRKNPMHFWGNGHQYGKYDGKKDVFYFDVCIRLEDRDLIYKKAKTIALRRIKDSMPGISIPYDFYDFRLDKEFDNILKVAESSPPLTEIDAVIKARVGQSKLRTLLFDRYETCILCKISHPKLLLASHIKPWSESDRNERLDLDNSLLLCPNHDKLFDKLLITFDESGRCLVNEKFKSHLDLRLLHIPEKPLVQLTDRNQYYLEFHRSKFRM